MQALHPQRRLRGGCRSKARASYVDDTLFGSPAGTRPVPPDFDPPWVQRTKGTRGVGARASQTLPAKGNCETAPSGDSTPTLTPGKKNKYRLIGHTPSYCDESLFGSRPEGASPEAPRWEKGDAARLRALFWTPPATPRDSLSPRPRETPVQAVHPTRPSRTEPLLAAVPRTLSVDAQEAPPPQQRGRSHSITQLNTPIPDRPALRAPHTNGAQDPRPSPTGVTFRSPLVTPRAQSISASVPAAPRRGGGTPRPKPPWR
ncbi:RBPJ-interacting and tubulin-associated protein 1 [Ctenodactylus gundi]